MNILILTKKVKFCKIKKYDIIFFMKKRKIIAIVIYSSLFILYFILTLYLNFTIKNPVKKSIEIENLSDKESFKKLPVELSFARHPTKQWYDGGNALLGAQYDAVLKNKSKEEIGDWNVVIDVPEESYIDSSWNGIFNIRDGRLVVRYNPQLKIRSIPIGGEITFGCIMYTDSSFKPGKCRIVYTTKKILTESKLFWFLIVAFLTTVVFLLTSIFFLNRIKIIKDKQQITQDFLEQSLKTFANAIEAKDKYTKGHSQRVSYYSKLIAEKIELPDYKVQNVYYSAILHDVGKILIPDEILNKKGKLNKEEMGIMKTHAELGSDVLRDFNSIPNLSNIVKYHHEKYDGSGYPDGLNGKKIPLESRIICIADSFDAMTTTRCYRQSLPLAEVIIELKKCSGSHFDPELVSAIIELIDEGKIGK